MTSPLVSIIVPNYNHAHYLTQRIDSVLNQSYENTEVIILDDCSKDKSRGIIESYRDNPRIKCIVINEVNSGSTFLQWKKGLEIAAGDWVWIAESDDYADLRFLEIMLSSFQDANRIGLLYCDSNIVINDVVQAETFAYKRNKKFSSTRWNFNYSNNGINEIQNYLMEHGTINNSSAVLFKRELLLKINPFEVPFRFIGDWYIFIKVLAIADIGYINIPLNYYRAAADSKPKHTTDYLDYFYESFLVFDWIDRNLKEIDRKKFDHAIKFHTEVSLISINAKKMRIFKELFGLNRSLFIQVTKNNIKRSLNRIWAK
jgi:glycosyltransferase involved in cell wall biosynthesis